MKKEGYTLIELLITMAISIFLLSILSNFAKVVIEPMNKVKITAGVSEVYSLISYSKHYCRKNNCLGTISINDITDEIIFTDEDNNLIKKLEMPKELDVAAKAKVEVRNTGYLSNSLSIKLIDLYGGNHYITISVGMDTVNIK